jgi:hypothetical protein
MLPRRQTAIGLTSKRFKTERPYPVLKLPPALCKLANYEYCNSQLSLSSDTKASIDPNTKGTRKSHRIAKKGVREIVDLTTDHMILDLTEDIQPSQNEIFDLTQWNDSVDLTGTDDCVDLTGEESMSNLTSSEGSKDDMFGKQCHITGYDRLNGDNRNVIIPYDDFILFLDNNFVFKKC